MARGQAEAVGVTLEVAHALVRAAVEVVGGRDTRLLCGLRKRIQDVPTQALLLDAPFASAAGVPLSRLARAAPPIRPTRGEVNIGSTTFGHSPTAAPFLSTCDQIKTFQLPLAVASAAPHSPPMRA